MTLQWTLFLKTLKKEINLHLLSLRESCSGSRPLCRGLEEHGESTSATWPGLVRTPPAGQWLTQLNMSKLRSFHGIWILFNKEWTQSKNVTNTEIMHIYWSAPRCNRKKGLLYYCCIHGTASFLLAQTGKVIVPDSHLITTITAHWINYSALRDETVTTGHQGA